MRSAYIYNYGKFAGELKETEGGTYMFSYDRAYLNDKDSRPISLRLPLQAEVFTSKILFPFFDGLIPEGWLLNLTTQNWKLDQRDRMGLLMVACEDCIGSVTVKGVQV